MVQSCTLPILHSSNLLLFQFYILPTLYSSNLTLFQPYTLSTLHSSNLTLFQSYTLQSCTHTLPILHSSNLTLFQSYTLLILHSSNLTLFQSYTLPILHSSNITLIQYYTLQILHFTNQIHSSSPLDRAQSFVLRNIYFLYLHAKLLQNNTKTNTCIKTCKFSQCIYVNIFRQQSNSKRLHLFIKQLNQV